MATATVALWAAVPHSAHYVWGIDINKQCGWVGGLAGKQCPANQSNVMVCVAMVPIWYMHTSVSAWRWPSCTQEPLNLRGEENTQVRFEHNTAKDDVIGRAINSKLHHYFWQYLWSGMQRKLNVFIAGGLCVDKHLSSVDRKSTTKKLKNISPAKSGYIPVRPQHYQRGFGWNWYIITFQFY